MSAESEPRDSLEVALERTAHMLDTAPVLAADQCLEILKAVEFQPEHPEAWRYLADHFTATGDTERADTAFNGQADWSNKPCLNVDKGFEESENVSRFNATWNVTDDHMVYFTGDNAITAVNNGPTAEVNGLEIDFLWLAGRRRLGLDCR